MSDQILFGGGLAFMVITIIAGTIYSFAWLARGKKLQIQLEREYGPQQNEKR